MEGAGTIRRLRVAGAIAVLTIALLTLASAAFTAWRYSTAPGRTEIINRSGLRRGQSVAVLYRAERLGRFPAEVPQLEAAIAKLDKSQSGLMDLSPADEAFYESFLNAARAVAAHPRDVRLRDELDSLGDRMYQIYYTTTVAYSDRTGAQRIRSFTTTMAGSAAMLLLLGLLYAFVIRPSERFVVRNVRELEERRQRFAAMFDNSSEMMAVYDAQGRIVRANSAALHALGFGAGVVGERFEVHVAPQDRDVVAQAFAQAIDGKASEVGISFLNASGRQIPVLASLSPIVVGERVVGVVGAAHDMTSERQFERQLLHGRERFRSLFEASQNAIVAFSPQGIVTEINVAMERLSGYHNENLVGKHVSVLVPPEFRDLATRRIATVLEGTARTYRIDMLARDGTTVAIDAEFQPIRIAGRSEGVFLIGKDLTREEALARVDQRDERMRALYRIASSAEAAADSQIDDALGLGAQALRLEYGYVSHIVDGVTTIEHRLAPDDAMSLGATFPSLSIGQKLMASPRTLSVDDLTVEPYATELRERALPWKSFIGSRVIVDSVPYGALVFFGSEVRSPGFEQTDRDFIDLMSALIGSALARLRLQSELSDMAFHDSLTGLANRALLAEHVGRAIGQAQRSHGLVAIHYLDLNRFKPVNDAHGHDNGDLVLREAARRFSAAVRAHDVVARIGGDEFVVLQTGISDEAPIRLLANRLEGAMAAPFALADGATVSVGVSVGTSIYPRDGADIPGLIRAADAAMYHEKTTTKESR
jgi:diguanylate cyclase (GGDEF)-like protein/PAS domain S-box-containing protein